MNRQPFGIPPKWWAPKLTPWAVKLTRKYRHRKLRRGQRLVSIEAEGLEHVERILDAGHGVLIAPNHSAHYDSAALYAAMDQIGQPVYFMTAWQVFAMTNRLERWAMQRLGCFSIDRESTDRQAFKQAVQILRQERHPLVIFPEGDIYHVSDRVTPFREGAAAIALSAAKRAERPISVAPCAIKFRYIDDPTAHLHELMLKLEQRFHLRPQPHRPLTDRIYRLAEGLLALKELDYLGGTRSGTVKERIGGLSAVILSRLEEKYDVTGDGGTIPERIKPIRQRIIQLGSDETEAGKSALDDDMEDVFFVMQLFSYPGNYLRENPTIERLAETLDKMEEDILGLEVPTVRGRRRVLIRFGEPIQVKVETRGRDRVEDLTDIMQDRVQLLLDGLSEAD